jgi:hypothetical protein
MIGNRTSAGGKTMRHPHAEAAYRVIRLGDGAFGVEVTIPETNPTTVSTFSSEEAAEDWIARHRDRVQSQELTTRRFRRSGHQSQ